jgi:cobalt-zinc-cadmium efflux system outer membrane protein
LPATITIKTLVPEIDDQDAPLTGYAYLLDSAVKNNADYNIEIKQLAYAKSNVALQKAMAVPDITIAPEYDQSSSYVSNYYGVSVNLPIPLWDRNRGNIKAAGYQLSSEQAREKQALLKLENDLAAATKKLLSMQKLLRDTDLSFYGEYKTMYNSIVESYNKRQIGIIEFLDFFDNYKEVIKNKSEQYIRYQIAREELNAVAGCNILQ